MPSWTIAVLCVGGVIMDVVNVEQAKIAEAAGAVAVMALERIPADIRYDGGVARMSDPEMIQQIKNAVTIPVMAKVRWRLSSIYLRSSVSLPIYIYPCIYPSISSSISIHQARIGHFVEAQILEAIEVDYIDESEVLTMADEENHINKNNFNVRRRRRRRGWK